MGYHIYKFYNETEECIYIGKTKNLKIRISEHKNRTWWGEVVKITYANFNNSYELNVFEPYLIYKLKPKYNIEYKDIKDIKFDLPMPKFRTYSYPNGNVDKEDIDEIFYNGFIIGATMVQNSINESKNINEMSDRLSKVSEVQRLIGEKKYQELEEMII